MARRRGAVAASASVLCVGVDVCVGVWVGMTWSLAPGHGFLSENVYVCLCVYVSLSLSLSLSVYVCVCVRERERERERESPDCGLRLRAESYKTLDARLQAAAKP